MSTNPQEIEQNLNTQELNLSAPVDELVVPEKKKKASPKKKKAAASTKKTMREKLAEKKAEKISSPYRKTILSRETLQYTIPAHVRDLYLIEAGEVGHIKDIELPDLLDFMGKVTWNPQKKCIEIRPVPTKVALGL